MREDYEYIAKTEIWVGGVRGYMPGDPVPASAVENLGLGPAQVRPSGPDVLPRPARNAKRAEWEQYWRGQGMADEDIDAMTRDELAAKDPEVLDTDEGTNVAVHVDPDARPGDVIAEQVANQTREQDPARPADNARKADWVAYAVARGMPEDTAKDSTIAQLAEFDYADTYGR